MAETYVQVKIRFCKAHPFTGLSALGMWYGYVVKWEIDRWENESRTAVLSPTAKEMVALCTNQGLHLRKVLTDGKLLKVYDFATNRLRDDTLLPTALLGQYMELIEISDIPKVFRAKGGFRAQVTIDGFSRCGWILPGKGYNAFWGDDEKAYHSENPGAKNPNTTSIKRLN